MDFKFDIIACSETWLSDSNYNCFPLPGYTFLSRHRPGKGGGVGLYLREKLCYTVLDNLTTVAQNSHESIFVKISLSNGKFINVGCIYRSPSYSAEIFLNNYLKSCLDILKGKKTIISGDLNFNLMESEETRNAKSFLDVMTAAGLISHINRPTRITKTSCSVLDVIFSNLIEFKPLPKIIIHDLSDHLPVCCLFETPKQNTQNYTTSQYLINERTLSLFRLYIENDILLLPEVEDVNTGYSILLTKIKEASEKAFIINRKGNISKHVSKIPWLSPDLRKACKIKNKLFKEYLRNKTVDTEIRYKTYRNQLNSLLRRSRKDHIALSIENAKNDSRKLWKILNDTINHKSRACSSVSLITDSDGNKITDKKEIANLMNNFFASVGSRISSDIPNAPGFSFNDYLPGNFPNTMHVNPTTPEEIRLTYRQSKKSNATDVDGLNRKVFDSILDLAIIPITNLFNLSFLTCKFPSEMKIAKIIPLYKSGDKTQPSNYRPISILPLLSKLLEKLFCKRLQSFIFDHNIICPEQFGFQKSKSTTLAAINYFELVTESLKNKKSVLSISLDFSKAFDSIAHAVLFEKLRIYGIRGNALTWLQSYLTDRSHQLALENGTIMSEKALVAHGVPQGSILGPTLFLIYINDIPKCTPAFDFILFADDTTLLCQFDPMNPQEDNINQELRKVETWLKCNKLALNVKKTQAIIYQKPNENSSKIQVQLAGKQLKFSNSINFLGIIFDEKLCFSDHVKKVRAKLSRSLGMLNRAKNFIPLKSRKLLYNALIQPHLSYGIELWGGSGKNILDVVQKLQNKAIRFVENTSYGAHTLPLFNKHKILKVNDLYTFQLQILMFKAFHQTLPSKILQKYSRIQTGRLTRQVQWNLAVARKSSKLQNSRPSICGPHIWNGIPADLRKLNSLATLKKKLREIFVDQYN